MRFETKIEFKSYGLYSEVAKQLKADPKQSNISIDQIDAIYSWYIKNIVKGLSSNDALQANLKGLGKIKFHFKKGSSRLKHNQGKLIKLVDYYYEVVKKESLAETEEEKQHLSTRIKYIYLILKKQYPILNDLGEEYLRRLEKYYMKGSMTEKNYLFFQDRYETFTKNQSELYESIQRVFRAYEERSKEH